MFHDDQHGTAIIAAAGLLNSLDLTGRNIEDTKIVCNGAGAAGIACLELLEAIGFKHENLILCDTKGVIYQGRTEGMNQWKSAHAVKTSARTLAEAMKGADVFYGLSAKGAVTKDMVKSMAAKPIIFAMANPDPEITAEEVAEVRDDAIMATGRSDYPNQVNNVLGFPYIFRGALDVRATAINMEMKIAAARALAALAREDVPDEVAAAYGARPKFGPDYIIPVPFDPRLISHVPPAVAKAAMDTGVARKPIVDMDAYRAAAALARATRSPASLLQVFAKLRRRRKRVVFAEGEEEQVIRAAASFVQQGSAPRCWSAARTACADSAKEAGIELGEGIEIINAALSKRNAAYVAYLYERLQRQGYLIRDVPAPDQQRPQSLRRLHGGARRRRRHGHRRHPQLLGGARGRPARASIPSPAIASSACRWCWRAAARCWSPTPRSPKCRTPQELAEIAIEAAGVARRLGYEPRLAMLAFSTFGHPQGERSARVIEAVQHPRPAARRFRIRRRHGGRRRAQSGAGGGLSVLPACPAPPTC